MPEQLHTINNSEETSFIGLRSYTEEQANMFFGRDEEIDQLTSLVESNTLTIVFGKSGTGKTSLLNAGVFPRLRKNYCLPFRIRLEFQEGSPDLVSQVKKVLRSEIDKYGFKVESYPSTETLWEYFHKEPLWKTVTPILIFDQFEEIFTLAQKNSSFGTTEFSVFWEGLRFLFSMGIIYFYGDWFGMSTFLPFSNAILIAYFALSLLMSSYFVFVEFRNTQNQLSYDN